MKKNQRELLKKEIEIPYKLKNGLERLTKAELDFGRKYYNVKKSSSLNKEELIEVMNTKIPERVWDMLWYLSEERYQFIRRIVKAGGWLPIEEVSSNYQVLMKQGLVFPGSVNKNEGLAVPQEVAEVFVEVDSEILRKNAEQNSLYIALTKGMLYYYGVLEVNVLVELLEKYLGKEPRVPHLFGVLDDEASYNESFSVSYAHYAYPMSQNILNEVIKEHKKREDLSFYQFTKEQLLQAAYGDYMDRSQQAHNITRQWFLKGHS